MLFLEHLHVILPPVQGMYLEPYGSMVQVLWEMALLHEAWAQTFTKISELEVL